MPQTHDAVVLSQTLAARGRLPATEAEAIFRQLLTAVSRLHQAGRIHRAIRAEKVAVTSDGRIGLAKVEALVELHGPDSDPAVCPPEVRLTAPLMLPAETGKAAEILSAAGVQTVPQRFDVYQLGVLLLQMLTGQSVDAYLRSPRVKNLVPERYLPAILGALGFAEAERIAQVDGLAVALDGLAATRAAETPPRGSAAPNVPASAHGDTPLPDSPVVPAPRDSVAPQQLGHYRIVRRIGRGGMGDVYLGFEEELNRQVAIKVLPVELARNEDLVNRFLAEAAAIAKIAHPHIVPIYFIGHDAGRHFYAMQYVEGESLDRLLMQRRQFPTKQALAIIEQCLTGLEAVHQAGLIHRDIKPANILIDRNTQRALVADFGLVKAGEGGPTASGVVLGTVDYMAPEIARGQKADARCDQYAVGVMAYQMLSGRLPFSGDTPTAVLFQHAYESAPRLREVAPDVPPPVADFVDKLMAKSPADRYANCTAARAALRRALSGKATATNRSAPTDDQLGPALSDPELVLAGIASPQPWWRRLGTRLAALVSPHAGGRWAGSMTVQEVDAAVEQCESRREQLARLLADAQEAARALAPKPGEPDAGIASSSCAQLEADVASLRSQLADADANLARLRGQRDLLKARLRAAQSEDMPQRSRRPYHVVAGLAALTVVGLVVLAFNYPSNDSNSSAVKAIAPTPVPPGGKVVTPIPIPIPTPSPPSLPIEVKAPVRLPRAEPGQTPWPEDVENNHDAIEAILKWNGTADIAEKIVPGMPLEGKFGRGKNFDKEKEKEKGKTWFLRQVQFNDPNVNDIVLERVFKGKHLRGVKTFHLGGTKVTGPGLAYVAESMPYLENLFLSMTPVNDKGMQAIAPLSELKELTVNNPSDKQLVTDKGMQVLANFKELYSLNLRWTQVGPAAFQDHTWLPRLAQFNAPPAFDDSAMEFLKNKSLKTLDISQTKVTDAGLKHLTPGKYFTDLRIDETSVTDAGLDSVVKIKTLKSLGLDGTQITDAGLAKLKDLPDLSRLHLSRTNITDDGLKHLQALPKLQMLHLEKSKITKEALPLLATFKHLTGCPESAHVARIAGGEIYGNNLNKETGHDAGTEALSQRHQ